MDIKRIKIIIAFLILVLPMNVLAVVEKPDYLSNPPPNPSAAYCEDLGYEFIIQETPEGDLGICKFSENYQAPAWGFLRGEESQEYSYCSQAGYEMKIIDNPEKCGFTYKPGHGCLACVLANGEEIEVSNLMKRDRSGKSSFGNIIQEQICQIDGECMGGENSDNCLQDCVLAAEEPGKYLKYLFWLGIVLAFVIALVVLVKIKTDRKNFNRDKF